MKSPSYVELLGRANESHFQDLLGQSTIRLLRVFNGQDFSVSSLRELFLELFQPAQALSDDAKRRIFFELLQPHEARNLVLSLGLPEPENAFECLIQLDFARGSRRYNLLLEQLSVVVIEESEVFDETEALIRVTPAYSLFSHQRKAVSDCMTQLAIRPYRVLLHMPTGAGKTRTAMNIIAQLLREHEPFSVLWLASVHELCEQSAQEFEKCWRSVGNREVTVHRFYGNADLHTTDIHDGVVVAGFQKLYKTANRDMTFLARLGDRVNLVVVDEAHQAIARSYRDVIESVISRNERTRLLGLSATPGRTYEVSEADRELSHFFGTSKVALRVAGFTNPIEYLVQSGYLAMPKFRSISGMADLKLNQSERIKLARDFEVPQHLINRLAENDLRNVQIVREVKALANRHKRILVFAATVKHAKLLAVVLRTIGVAVRSISHETPTAERRQTILWYKANSDDVRVLTNFGILTTGFDAPATSAAVIGRPTKSLVLFSQMVGRATRGHLAGGNREAEIVSIVDTELQGFGSLSEAFVNWDDVWDQ